jgi:hypothetical protein
MESSLLKQKELQLFLKPKLLKLLERTSLFLRVYRSGKLPKILRIVWEAETPKTSKVLKN